ncbi:MAG: SigE family RNA polymerase sigma factor [Acidimicrobiia bacterium]|nr:SigE family RNA polymerase sigma factor [Acidimicrobiia bacterium]
MSGRLGKAWVEAEVSEPVVVRPVESFETFYRREFRRMVAIAYALSGSRLAAEDLAQEAFIAAHRSWDRIGRYERPDAWVRKVISNKAVSAYRRRTSEARALLRIAGQRQEIIRPMDAEDAQFWDTVRTLPTKQRQAVVLHYVEDLPVAEIAEILGCAVNTAKVHLFKARKNLAAKLGLEVAS